MSHRLPPQTSSHPGVSEPSYLPHDRPPGGVILLLNEAGMVESVQTFGSEPGSSGSAHPSGFAPEFPGFNPSVLEQSSLDWVGQRLLEVVTFSDPGAFAQALTLLTPHSQPLQLQGQCQFQGQLMDMIWVVQPLIGPGGTVVCRTAVGYWLGAKDLLEEDWAPSMQSPPRPQDFSRPLTPTLCTQLQAYSPRLNQITRHVRWTLDLETIRRQTVDGLGELFGVSRCLVCSYSDELKAVIVEAEYRQGADLPAWQGQTIPPAQSDYLERAVQASGAVLAIDSSSAHQGGHSVIAVATRYQNNVNGFILLYDAANRPWSELELGLIADLADQVGTAMAHASLFADSNALSLQLQQANHNLMEKQKEFYEARRQAEEARQQAEEASRLKSEFLANTSHELRTPLNGMIGFLKLVLDGMADDPQEQQEFIQEAHKSALHLLNLINDVLDIAKIEAGKMQIDMGPVKLRELLADIETFIRPQAEQKGLYFNILLPATRDEITLNGNYQRLLQVFLNLLSNAVKFTHEGGITISAEVKSQRVEYKDKIWPGTVKMSVADTGIGVSLEKQDRLFQTFSQVDGERTRQYGGTGLGLTISQKLVEAMGGVVQFISMGEGLGSTVTFTALLYHEPVMIAKEPVYPAS